MTIQETDRKWVDALKVISRRISGTDIVALYFVNRETGAVDPEKTLISFLSLHGVQLEEK